MNWNPVKVIGREEKRIVRYVTHWVVECGGFFLRVDCRAGKTHKEDSGYRRDWLTRARTSSHPVSLRPPLPPHYLSVQQMVDWNKMSEGGAPPLPVRQVVGRSSSLGGVGGLQGIHFGLQVVNLLKSILRSDR